MIFTARRRPDSKDRRAHVCQAHVHGRSEHSSITTQEAAASSDKEEKLEPCRRWQQQQRRCRRDRGDGTSAAAPRATMMEARSEDAKSAPAHVVQRGAAAPLANFGHVAVEEGRHCHSRTKARAEEAAVLPTNSTELSRLAQATRSPDLGKPSKHAICDAISRTVYRPRTSPARA
jgi:hypothetical protein